MPENAQAQAAIATLFPPLAAYAKQEGLMAAEELFDTLASANTRPAWTELINKSNVAQEAEILSSTRQGVISATLAKIKREVRTWELAKAALTFALSLVPLLL